MLIVILLATSKAISQTVTNNVVILTEDVATQAIKDLIKGDFCQEKVIEQGILIGLLENQIMVQKAQIKNLEDQDVITIKVVKNKDKIIFNKEIIEKELSSENVSLKNKNTFWKIATGVATAAAIFTAIKK